MMRKEELRKIATECRVRDYILPDSVEISGKKDLVVSALIKVQ
jgi:hypothetical protein